MINLPKTVTILDSVYKIEVHKKAEDAKLKRLKGYCNMGAHLIVLLDVDEVPKDEIINPDEWAKMILRHEIVHAFLNESGLSYNTSIFDGPWAKNEEMIDWFAIQGPKIIKCWKKLGIA